MIIRDSGHSTKNRDCPAKFGTVGQSANSSWTDILEFITQTNLYKDHAPFFRPNGDQIHWFLYIKHLVEKSWICPNPKNLFTVFVNFKGFL